MTGPYFIRATYAGLVGTSFLLGPVYPTQEDAERGLNEPEHVKAEALGYMHWVIEASEATPEEVARSLRTIVKRELYPEFHDFWIKQGKGYDPVADIVYAVQAGRMLPENAIGQLHRLAQATVMA
jgi:hypothetical protein